MKKLLWTAAIAAAIALAFVLGLLVAGSDHQSHSDAPAAHAADAWTCAMHPQVRAEEPGQCPICGMDLVPVSGLEESMSSTRVSLSDRARKLAQIRTVEVARAAAGAGGVQLLGRVDYDETQLKSVTAWTAGRIDRLHIAATGERVRRGQVIATLYSPEIYAAQQDLIEARKQAARLAGGTDGARAGASGALAAARKRLTLLGVPSDEVDRMAAAEAPSHQMSIRSPIGGTVIERSVDEGEYLAVGAPIYRVADLSKVWLQLDAYERDLPAISVGQTVTLTARALPGRTFEGTVAFIDPVIDAATRTARVRVEVANSERGLKPGMFAQAIIAAAPAEAEGHAHRALMIPASAPLFAGRRSLVYVEMTPTAADRPIYESRQVRLAPKTGDAYPVISGLRAGERVVMHGAFVLDADLQIRGGRSLMTLPDDVERGPSSLSAKTRSSLEPVVAAYLAMQRELAGDDLSGAQGGAKQMLGHLDGLTSAAGLTGAWVDITKHLRAAGAATAAAADLDTARRAFENASGAIVTLLETLGNPLDVPVRLAWCPMAIDDRSALWVQTEPDVRNPYHGAHMLSCGHLEDQAEPGHLMHHTTHDATRHRGHGGSP